MQKRLLKFSGLGVLLLAFLLLISTPVLAAPQAATITVNLCASDGTITMPDGAVVPIWTYVDIGAGTCTTGLASSLPGATILADVGDTVVINLQNSLSVSTSILIPGQSVSATGGSAGIFTTEVAPGGSATYTISSAAAGTYMYESGTDSDIQVAMGLHGALVVESTSGPYGSVDAAVTLVLGEIDPALNNNPSGFDMLSYAPKYWLINGKAYPNTDPILVGTGDTLLLRYLNVGYNHHAMALLGAHQRVIGRNGFVVPNSFLAVAETVPAGQTLDVTIATSSIGKLALYSRNMNVTNAGTGPGGMRTFIDVMAGQPNSPPIAQNDSAATTEGQAVDITVLGNDSDPDGDPLTVTITTPPANGSAIVNPNKTISYTPNGGFSGNDSLVYTIDDGNGGTDSGTVFITVTAIPGVTCAPGSYFSKLTNRRINGVRYRKHDIVFYDGTNFSLFFDGSEVGIANNVNVDAFAFITCDQILLSFNRALSANTLPGITTSVDDSDIVLFTATAYGDGTTTGSFSLFLDGSDVGLTTNGEDIDAIDYLAGGELLISTYGTARVGSPRVTARDEDLLIFTPTAPNDYSNGTWAVYFDASDVGLTKGAEDVDAVSDGGGVNLFLSTLGSFMTTNPGPGKLSGADEDLFICNGLTSGLATNCISWSMHIDGSAAGISTSDDINAFDHIP